MRISSPFDWLPESAGKGAVRTLMLLTIVLVFAMQVTGAGLKNPAVPDGILSFEFAKTSAGAAAVLDSWDARAKMFAGLNLGLDYLFLVAYSSLLALLCHFFATKFWKDYRNSIYLAGVVLAWLQLLAGLLDAVENFALIQLLTGATHPVWPALAYWTALPKFALVGLGIGFVLLSLIWLIIQRFILKGDTAGIRF